MIEAHEELKKAVVVCMNDLVKNSSTSIIELFYTRQYAALLSHGIYLCVKLARLEKSAALRYFFFFFHSLCLNCLCVESILK